MKPTTPLSMVVYGPSGVGKTWLAMTAPAPRLFLDVEGRSRFAVRRGGTAGWWDPTEPIPEDAAKWDTTVVTIRTIDTLSAAWKVLAKEDHPWKSVVIDSLTEAQKRMQDALTGSAPLQLQDWGVLLRKMEAMVRSFRDLTEHPERPLDLVLFTAMEAVNESDGVRRPLLQGQIQNTLPYYVDVCGFLGVVTREDTTLERRLCIQPSSRWVAKDATDILTRHFGSSIPDPNLETIWNIVQGD